MYPPSLRQPITQIQEKKYWRTYLACTILLAVFGIANMAVSVHSMYASNTSQELEFKRTQLTQQIRELEQERAHASNIQTVQALAEKEGYTAVEHLIFVESPSTQIVAQR